MQILNIAGYKFITLSELSLLQGFFQENCLAYSLKGTILLSQEGVNINLAGTYLAIEKFKALMQNDARFMSITFHETYSDAQPFQCLKIKIKKEIITLRHPESNPTTDRAPCIQPAVLKQWLDEGREMTLLDTRNDYEIQFGTFQGAVNLNLDHFCELPSSGMDHLDRHKPIVMFCTGGIRCEKAAIYMIKQGFSEVYQLDGGILGYFATNGAAHYSGKCFVFDERVAIGPDSLL
jgi:UPF0176 protein